MWFYLNAVRLKNVPYQQAILRFPLKVIEHAYCAYVMTIYIFFVFEQWESNAFPE